MPYRHGVYVSEVATSIISTVSTDSAIPFVVGTAPVNMVDETNVNKPQLLYNYAEAVAAFGYLGPVSEGNNTVRSHEYTLCEFMKSHFSLYGAAPVIFVNVLDPAVHKVVGTSTTITLGATTGEATINQVGVIPSTVVLSLEDDEYTMGTDYIIAFDPDGKANIISNKDGQGAFLCPTATALTLSYYVLDLSAVDGDDVIGGVDAGTGEYTGLELINECFSRFRLTPSIIVSPKYSRLSSVAAVMAAKASSINEHFRAIALVDIPSGNDEIGGVAITGAVKTADVAATKNNSNIVEPEQIACWPCLQLSGERYWMSTQLAGLLATTDAENSDVPYISPSNKTFRCDGTCLEDGTEVWLDGPSANSLNGQGIITGLNFVGGWRAWGNRTACYPSNTDVKDSFIPVRRMFDWIGNKLVLTFWQKVDGPLNRRLIETIIDSANVWLNALAANQFILGGRVEFLEQENDTASLLDGKAKFHVYVSPAPPARDIEFVLEYDVAYLSTLFGE